MKILVVGGAGYIGSHMVVRLLQDDVEVAILDKLSVGYRDSELSRNFFIPAFLQRR